MSTQFSVYDVIGNEVATLVNEEKPAGSYEIKFSTRLTRLPDGQVHPSAGCGAEIMINRELMLNF